MSEWERPPPPPGGSLWCGVAERWSETRTNACHPWQALEQLVVEPMRGKDRLYFNLFYFRSIVFRCGAVRCAIRERWSVMGKLDKNFDESFCVCSTMPMPMLLDEENSCFGACWLGNARQIEIWQSESRWIGGGWIRDKIIVSVLRNIRFYFELNIEPTLAKRLLIRWAKFQNVNLTLLQLLNLFCHIAWKLMRGSWIFSIV